MAARASSWRKRVGRSSIRAITKKARIVVGNAPFSVMIIPV